MARRRTDSRPRLLLAPLRPRIAAAAGVVVALALAGCSGPFVTFPGGELDGTVTAAPDDWAFTDEIDTIQLETRPSEPYSVNIWVTAMDQALYVHAGANRATWVEHMEADPRVRLRVDESIFELAATRVTDPDEFARFAEVYEQKYGNRPRNENVDEAYLFRLSPRS